MSINHPTIRFQQPASTQAGGYTLVVAGILVAISLILHPLPTHGFEENASQLEHTPLWGVIHIGISIGFVLCIQGGLLVLVGGGTATRNWISAFSWGAFIVGILFFTGVALINGWVLHDLAHHSEEEPLLYDAMNNLLVGFGWLGNPLFLVGLTGIAVQEVRFSDAGMRRELAWAGLIVTLLAWGRGVGSATGIDLLVVLILANVPAFLWFSYYGWLLARKAQRQIVQTL
jgi:hypothetical protein